MCPTNCALRSPRYRRCWRTSSTAWLEPVPDNLRAALKQTERLGELVTDLLDLLPRREVARSPLQLKPVRRRGVPARCCRAHTPGRGHRRPTRSHRGAGRPGATASGGGEPGGQRHPAQPARRAGARAMPAPARGLQLDVLDDGPGIPAAERERVFQRFTRGRHLRWRHRPGPGDRPLGRRIARRHPSKYWTRPWLPDQVIPSRARRNS